MLVMCGAMELSCTRYGVWDTNHLRVIQMYRWVHSFSVVIITHCNLTCQAGADLGSQEGGSFLYTAHKVRENFFAGTPTFLTTPTIVLHNCSGYFHIKSLFFPVHMNCAAHTGYCIDGGLGSRPAAQPSCSMHHVSY